MRVRSRTAKSRSGFGERVESGRLRRIGIAKLVRDVEFLEALDDHDIVLTALPDRAK